MIAELAFVAKPDLTFAVSNADEASLLPVVNLSADHQPAAAIRSSLLHLA